MYFSDLHVLFFFVAFFVAKFSFHFLPANNLLSLKHVLHENFTPFAFMIKMSKEKSKQRLYM